MGRWCLNIDVLGVLRMRRTCWGIFGAFREDGGKTLLMLIERGY